MAVASPGPWGWPPSLAWARAANTGAFLEARLSASQVVLTPRRIRPEISRPPVHSLQVPGCCRGGFPGASVTASGLAEQILRAGPRTNPGPVCGRSSLCALPGCLLAAASGAVLPGFQS